jgi:DNA-directed RNA polymerase subunit M/transcription elongation factor TFIIS
MAEREKDIKELVCHDCSAGRELLSQIRRIGDEDIITFYKIMFCGNSYKLLPEICNRPKNGLCQTMKKG